MKKSKDIKLLAMAIIEESLGKIKGIAKGNTFGKMDSRILENGKMDLNRAQEFGSQVKATAIQVNGVKEK